jgi:GGDEF domain-containing protein
VKTTAGDARHTGNVMSRWMCAVALTLALLGTGPATACGLQVEVLYTTSAHDAPPAAVPVLARRQAARADAAVRTRLPQRAGGHWMRLSCAGRMDSQADGQLIVDGPDSLGPLTLYPTGAAPSALPARLDTDAPRRARGWALALPHGWPAGSIAYLHAAGTSVEPIALRVATTEVLVREAATRAWRARAAAAVLVTLALAMLTIHLRHRGPSYLSYAGYCVCAASYLVVQAGADGRAFAAFIAHGATVGWALATLAIALQLAFTRRVLELDRLVPMAARLVHTLFALHVALLAVLLIGRTHVHGVYPTVANALLVASAPLVLGAAAFAWHRGGAYAGYYLVGWTPLIAVLALLGADRLGLVAAPWAASLLAPAAVGEALVLAFALTRQAAHRRRIGRRLRTSHERDVLTGAPNAVALTRLLDAWRDLGALGARGHAVILVELDALDAIAARHGLPVANAALCQAHARCRALLHDGDTLARVGSARFAVVREGDRADAERFAQALVDALTAQPFGIDGTRHPLHARAGVAVAVRGEQAGRLMQRARQALRQSGGADATAAADAAAVPWRQLPRVHAAYGETPAAFTADA